MTDMGVAEGVFFQFFRERERETDYIEEHVTVTVIVHSTVYILCVKLS
jgi:hypothetical protein